MRRQVPFMTFGCGTLVADGDANKLFMVFMFSDHELDVYFLKDVRLISSSTEFSRRPKQVRSVTSRTT
jgi:hypothetical protein